MLSLVMTCGAVTPHAGWASDPKPPRVSWIFTTTHANADGTPHTRVSLNIGARRVLIAARLTGDFQVVPPQEYKSRHVPAAAAIACTGWWAGQGQDFYAVRRHGYWQVFRRDLDEEGPDPVYRRVKSIPMR